MDAFNAPLNASLLQAIRILTALHLLGHNERVWAKFVGPRVSALMPVLMDKLRSNNLVGPSQELYESICPQVYQR